MEDTEQETQDEEESEIGVPCNLEFIKGDKKLLISATAWSRSGWSLRQIGSTLDGYQVEAAHVDEPLLNSFYDYLAERGVDDEMAMVVTSTAYKTDRQLYQGWAQDMTNYFQAK